MKSFAAGMRQLGFAVALWGLGACAGAPLEEITHQASPAWSTLDQAIEARVAAQHYSGAVFAVAQGEHLLHQGAIGRADIAQGAPMRPDTIFRQMSLTKPVTAVAVMILVDEAKIDLDVPVSRYLPELEGYVFDGTPVTARHLLTHTSGFGVLGTFPTPDPNLTLEARVRQLADLRPRLRPGVEWQYSAFDGFDILARLIEVVAQEPYEVFLARRIFEPLAMHDTTFHLTSAQHARLAELYSSANSQLRPTSPIMPMPSYPAGGAGLYSTAPDMLRFAQMLANEGRLGHRRILSTRAVAQIRSEQLATSSAGLNPGMAWGLGVRVVGDPALLQSPLHRGAFGWSGAYGAHLWIDPDTRIAAVWMISTTTGGGAGSPHALEFERLVTAALVDAS